MRMRFAIITRSQLVHEHSPDRRRITVATLYPLYLAGLGRAAADPGPSGSAERTQGV